MQINTAATIDQLVVAYDATQAAIHALESLDVSPVEDAATELLRDRRNLVADELLRRGLRECGVCRAPKPGAVDWGCTCGRSAEELGREAADFARIHD